MNSNNEIFVGQDYFIIDRGNSCLHITLASPADNDLFYKKYGQPHFVEKIIIWSTNYDKWIIFEFQKCDTFKHQASYLTKDTDAINWTIELIYNDDFVSKLV